MEDSVLFDLSEKFSIIATGRRKKAVAQVKLISEGEGKFTINGKSESTYLQEKPYPLLCLKAPFLILNREYRQKNTEKQFDFIIKVKGGGFLGQAEAIRLGVSRAIVSMENLYRYDLKYHGFLKRDSRSKERKKYGLKKARKAPQYSKR